MNDFHFKAFKYLLNNVYIYYSKELHNINRYIL